MAINAEGTGIDAARALFNLLCLQGPGKVSIEPWSRVAELESGIERLDPHLQFRGWWQTFTGSAYELVEVEPPKLPIPFQLLRPERATAGRTVGVNVGAGYIRIVHLDEGVAVATRSVPLRPDGRNLLGTASIADFAAAIRQNLPGRVSSVGIAWSAPRIEGVLRPASIAMSDAGQLAEAMLGGSLDSRLAEELGCWVSSWHDGEAAAAGEVIAAGAAGPHTRLVLKLGTSVGAGLAVGRRICALPLQVSKCTVGPCRRRDLEHPLVGLQGTIRCLVGAEGLGQSYSRSPAPNWDAFDTYCRGLTLGDARAARMTARASAALSSVVAVLSQGLDIGEVVLTGRNLECQAMKDVMLEYPTSTIPAPGPVYRLGQQDVDLAAAIGAAALSRSSDMT